MKINYTVDKDDLTAALKYFHRRNSSGLKQPSWPYRLCGLFIFYSFFGDELSWALSGYGFGPGLVVGLASLAALLVLAPRLVHWIGGLDIRRTVKFDLRLPATGALELRDDGFLDSSDGLELKWARLKELAVVDGGRIYILTRGLEFFVVPPSAFRDPAERDRFLDQLAASSGLPLEGRTTT